MKRFLFTGIFLSAAALSFAADTVSYRLSRIENWAFYGTQSPTVELVAENDRGIAQILDIKCSILSNAGVPLYELLQRGTVPQKDSLAISFAFKTLEPGFYNAVLWSGERVVNSVNIAYEPEKIACEWTVEEGALPSWGDFRKLANIVSLERRDIDPGFTLQRNKVMSGKEKNVYDFRMVSRDGKVIKGYAAFPKGAKGLKAMVTLVAAEKKGENPLADFTAPANMAELVVYLVERGEGEEYFKNMLTDTQLCIDFLSQRPEINPYGIYVQGEGKAAACSYLSSALDERVAASFVAAPDFTRFVENFSVESMAGKVSAPVLFGFGLQDRTSRLQEGFALYNGLKNEKEYFIFPLGSSVERNKWKYIRDTFILRLGE